MQVRLFLSTFVVFSAFSFAAAEEQSPLYRIEKDQIEKDGRSIDRMLVARKKDRDGKNTLYVTVPFKITRADNQPATDVLPDEIKVHENGRLVANVEIQTPLERDLTTVLAIDISGSMAEHGKMEEAKQAARYFLDRLDPKSQCGLILFDHKLRVRERPTTDRQHLRRFIDAAQPGGGTAYQSAAEAIDMLRGVKGRRAVVLMTDGVDLNSTRKLEEVIRQARTSEVPVYTVGVGEPGQNVPVTTVLVLDKSGSMDDPAEATDDISKMEALHRAATRFVDLMRPGAKTTLLPFSDEVEKPRPFNADKEALKEEIKELKAGGETALFDATYAAVATLVAGRPDGKRAVIVLTDGMDNCSSRRVREAINLARSAEIPLHMLGLGRKNEIDENTMKRMARETHGTYDHARNEQSLIEIFERLSIQLHDDGVDEAALRTLAEQTGGKYFPALDISKLKLIYAGLAEDLQTSYVVTFPSLRQDDDGTSRDIGISVWRKGVQVSDVLRGGYNVHGVVVPEMDGPVYLGLLVTLVGLLVLPAGLKRFGRHAA